MSGLFSTCPPDAVKFPGVNAVPSPAKKMRRGPSELNVSILLLELNAFGYGPPGPPNGVYAAAVAATPNEPAAVVAAWPCVSPPVAIDRRPRLVARCRKRALPEYLRMTMRLPAGCEPTCSNGS